MVMAALLAGRAALPFVGRGLARFGGRRFVATTGLGVGAGFAGQRLAGGGGDAADGLLPRRRRRKALTDSDIRTALTIASAISKKAAENFILMRVRGS